MLINFISLVADVAVVALVAFVANIRDECHQEHIKPERVWSGVYSIPSAFSSTFALLLDE
jgi:hypothetical protein